MPAHSGAFIRRLARLGRGVEGRSDGINYVEFDLGLLHKGQRLMIDVGSRAFHPHLRVYRQGTPPPVMTSAGNPAVIRLEVLEQDQYSVIVSTSSPGVWGQYSWAYAVCEQEVQSGGVAAEGKACDADWRLGKANYRKPVGEPIYWPGYQKFCSLGGCAIAGSDRNGNTWPTGFRTYSTASQSVEVFEELYDPRLDQTFYCRDK